MTVNGITLTTGQSEVYSVLKQYGPLPDHALVPLTQHVERIHQTSSSIRSRRAELTRKGLVVRIDAVKTGSGRKAGLFQAV